MKANIYFSDDERENECRIWKELGYEALPEECKKYPKCLEDCNECEILQSRKEQ